MFRDILVPVDLTDKNAGAIALARDFATREGRVTLLHVIETLDAPFEELEEFYRRLEDHAAERMAVLSRPLEEAGIPCDRRICFGKRVPEIVRFAATEGADLIVITSHRLDPEHPDRGWMTISHQVAIFASMPVLVVK